MSKIKLSGSERPNIALETAMARRRLLVPWISWACFTQINAARGRESSRRNGITLAAGPAAPYGDFGASETSGCAVISEYSPISTPSILRSPTGRWRSSLSCCWPGGDRHIIRPAWGILSTVAASRYHCRPLVMVFISPPWWPADGATMALRRREPHARPP